MVGRTRGEQRGTGGASGAGARRPFPDQLRGHGHPRLAALPSYARFREALAALADESDAALGVFLADVQACALTSPFGAACPSCNATVWPYRAQRVTRGTELLGTYRCECGQTFKAAHDVGSVTWRNGDDPTR